MNIIIHGKNIKIVDLVKNAVEKNLNNLQLKYNKYLKADMDAKVDIEQINNYVYRVNIYIQLLNQHFLQCTVENNDLYGAIKKILVPLEQQLRHLKTLDSHQGEESVSTFMTKEEVNDENIIIEITDNK